MKLEMIPSSNSNFDSQIPIEQLMIKQPDRILRLLIKTLKQQEHLNERMEFIEDMLNLYEDDPPSMRKKYHFPSNKIVAFPGRKASDISSDCTLY